MTPQNRIAAIVLGTVAGAAAGFMWWASTTGPAATTVTSTSAPATTTRTYEAPAAGPESASPVPELPSTLQITSPAAVLVAEEPHSVDEYGPAGNVAARFATAYLTRDRDAETWADNWASRAGNLAGPALQQQLTGEWAQQSSRVDGSRSTAQVSDVQPLPGAARTDTEQSLVVTVTQTEHVDSLENPLTTTVVLHLHLSNTDTGWVVDAILPQAN